MPYAANLEKLALPNVGEVVEAVKAVCYQVSGREDDMPINITMPALSPTMEEGNLAKWLVKEGDKVTSGDVIAEIETDKATMEVEAVDEGTVAKIVVPAGTEGVKVNALIAVLAAEGEDVRRCRQGRRRRAGTEGGSCPRPKRQAPAPQQLRPPQRRRRLRSPLPAARPRRPATARTFASPLARRIAKEAGIDIRCDRRLRPAWPRRQGRRRGGDRRWWRQGGACAPAPAAAPAAPRCQGHVGRGRCSSCSSRAPTSSSRTTTCARRSRGAWSRPSRPIPHFYLTLDCELDALLALRAQLNAAAPVQKTDKGDGRPTSSRSTTWSSRRWRWRCTDVPDANVSWTDSAMVKHKHADVGVAVSIPGGLITPIIRQAEHQDAVGDLQRDEGPRQRAPATAS